MASVNLFTLAAVTGMRFLQQLEWGIVTHIASEPPFDGASGANSVPLLSLMDDDRLPVDDEVLCLTPKLIAINELVKRLGDRLPATTIRVFKVPILQRT